MRFVVGDTPPLTAGKTVKFGSKGIDKLVLSFPITSFPTQTARHWIPKASRGWKGARTRAGRGRGQMLSVYISDRGLTAHFSLTPSYVYGREFNTAVPSDSCVSELAAFAHRTAIEWGIIPACAPDEMGIKQIDLTRNLALESGITASDYLLGLLSVTPTHARFKRLHVNPATNQAETLTVGSKSSRLVRVYDKLEQSGDPAAEGILRWEVQLKDFLTSDRVNIQTVGDATAKRLKRTRKALFAWSGMEHEVLGPVDAVHRLRQAVENEQLSAQAARGVLGSAVLGARFQSDQTNRRARSVLRDLGIVSDLAQFPEALRSGNRWVYRAHYRSGRITGRKTAK